MALEKTLSLEMQLIAGEGHPKQKDMVGSKWHGGH